MLVVAFNINVKV